MQNIVDKVFPHFAKEETAAEKAMQRAATAEEGGEQDARAAAESEIKRQKVEGNVVKRKKKQEKDVQQSSKKLCLSLSPNPDSADESKLPPLAKVCVHVAP
jgi:hypothetical protein